MKKIELTYIGRRLHGDSVFQFFTDGKTELPYRGLRGLVIGFVYPAQRYSDGKTTISKRPEALRESGRECRQWAALDGVAEEFLHKRRARDRAHDLVRKWAEFPELQRLCKGMTVTELELVISAIKNKLFTIEPRRLK
jgi:hypothetical protein